MDIPCRDQLSGLSRFSSDKFSRSDVRPSRLRQRDRAQLLEVDSGGQEAEITAATGRVAGGAKGTGQGIEPV